MSKSLLIGGFVGSMIATIINGLAEISAKSLA